MASSASSPRSSSTPWLYGPASDLLLGCGAGFGCLAIALLAWGDGVRALLPFSVLPFLMLFVGAPHYGATLLRVYEKKQDFRKYLTFSLFASALIWGLFVGGVYYRPLLLLLVTVYLSWSPWHYSGQNFGIAMMFLRRRGIPVEGNTRRLLHTSFTLSFALALLGLHSVNAAAYVPGSGKSKQFLSLGIPANVASVVFLVGLAAYLIVTLLAFVRLRQRTTWGQLAPSLVMAVTQSLWFVVPGTLGIIANAAPGYVAYAGTNAAYAFTWMAIFHMAQYMWVTTYYAEGPKVGTAHGLYYLKALLAGAIVWAVPALLFAPGLMGRIPYDLGLGILVAAAVNIHHFVLDGAIWKLRDSALARLLILRTSDAEEAAPTAKASGLRRILAPSTLVWTVGVASVCVLYLATWLPSLGIRARFEARDLPGLKRAASLERRIGRESTATNMLVAQLQAAEGDASGAVESAERAVSMNPTASGYKELGEYYHFAGRLEDAIRASKSALGLDPTYRDAAIALGQQLLFAAELDAARIPEALAHARMMVRASSGRHPGPLFVLARVLELAGAHQEAEATSLRVRELLVQEQRPDLTEKNDALLRRLATASLGKQDSKSG